MTRLYMLDTNMVSYILKGKSRAARARIASLGAGQIACISAVTEAELLYGIAKSGIGARRKQLLDWFVLRMTVYRWGREEAAEYGPLRAKQEAIGKTLGPLDMQIAAHAVALGAILITNDKSFQNVADLVGVENWATDL
ncbi:MAG TPA: type II toxin-antitoxin system VapC family toxin [Bryobacteraceae bacterium]|jgi:tRNA(fMet)-specific endonuclease VapC|nr:type II toxin-antitoxin system VapC family toxin [Bryobacteraceae bacterium]